MQRFHKLRHPNFIGALLGTLITSLAFVPAAQACPQKSKKGSGSCTKAFVKDGTFVKCTPTLKTKVTNQLGANSCSGNQHTDVPAAGNFIIWAAAAPDGFTGVFYGNSATGKWAYTKSYSVECGPCPPGTPINMSLDGSADYVQYAAAVGLAKILGSATSKVSGTLQVDPFPGSPFDVGANPASVTANAGFATTTAGSSTQQNTPFSSNVVKPCPQNDLTIRFDLAVTASRTGGATSATASFDKIEYDIDTNCDCGGQNTIEVEDGDETTTPVEVPREVRNPVYNPNLEQTVALPVDYPEALLQTPWGPFYLVEAEPRPADIQTWLNQGPTTTSGQLTAGAVIAYGDDVYGLVSSLVAGVQAAGPFAYGNVVGIEGTDWDASLGTFASSIDHLLIIDDGGFTTQLYLSEPLSVASALAFGNGGALFGQDLIVAEADGGRLVRVTPEGDVLSVLPENVDLGRPIDLAWAPADSALAGQLVILDIGQQSDDGVLQNGTGRVLTLDPATGAVAEYRSGLDAPVAITFANAALYGNPAGGSELLVLSSGIVQPDDGHVEYATGTLTAYGVDGESTLLISQLDAPTDVELENGATLVVATPTTLLRVDSAVAVEVPVDEPLF